ncbi:major facilitator superfamily MFS_1 [Leadbetterella byssophila DSM 17132]|uniref:Major facilitator superfamily MFS_1 n=1 Tax=Leadbetterella byssophila (strain DSM 17132 / JCM 16389 / KACC 11308 / NBRC 106382 / 4M15) TaxID=649349 RepID=E4RVF5_LEAB4|nr:MFS transporter [Leadbetterella byssophila]ADQ16141.1 major facilitator superfamily MFS_1 [Leadbetterella byssophila DSM 17132]
MMQRIGLPKPLAWGYLGILIFMMGDGMEQGWLSPYLIDRGLAMEHSATLFSLYGVTIAISSWFSGVLTESLNPRKTMWLGLLLYLLGTVLFIGIGLKDLDLGVLYLTYALRGFGYPLFAYSFLVWISYVVPQNALGRAVGWFWFVFTGGLNVLGAFYSSWAIEHLGHIPALWSAVAWVLVGAIFALVLNKATFPKLETQGKLDNLLRGLTIIKSEPKVALGGIVRIINTAAQFAFPVFLPVYMAEQGIDTKHWLYIWGTIFSSNIIFNLIFGFVGDRLGWRQTIMWFGGVGCGLTTLLFYYSPQWFEGNYSLVLACGVLWGACLAGYVPLSALVPSLVEKEKGAAMSILNLGAGLAVFAGPAIVWATFGAVGAEGVVWILAGLYFVSAVLTHQIKLSAKN